MHGVETILFLVVLGTVVAAFAGRLRVPAPSLLVIAGLVVALLPRFPPVHVPPEAVSLVVLPPLLYAASEELPWRDLRAVWRPVAVLAVGLVLASAAAVAAVTWAVAAVPASMAFVLGAVLASTDPVAVSALGRRLSLPPKVQALVQAESLFNDATSLVLFQIAVSFAVAGTAGPAGSALLHGAGQFAVLAAGGAAVGGVIAAGVIPVRRRVTDPVLETVLALITPYAAFVAGEVLHVSPVMAVIVAGLVIGGRRERITTAQTRLQLHSVYGTVIFLLESVVFSLIGLQLPTLIRDLSGPGVAGRGAGGGRDADRNPDRVGVPAVRGHPAARRRPAPVVAGARRGVLGGSPRGGAAGRGALDSADLGERGPAAARHLRDSRMREQVQRDQQQRPEAERHRDPLEPPETAGAGRRDDHPGREPDSQRQRRHSPFPALSSLPYS